MNVIKTEIPDVLIFEPKVFGDERGFFMESFNQKVFEEAVGCQPGFAGAVLSVYTGNRQWERGGDFFSGGGDPVDKSRFYRKDCC